jgi:hypothetical protein
MYLVGEIEKGDLLMVSLERMMHIVEYIVVGRWNTMLLVGNLGLVTGPLSTVSTASGLQV